MDKKPVLYKTLVVGVIVLFIGLGVQPAFADVSIKSDDSELEEITIQFYETDKTYNHTVMLTQEQVEELENLINSFNNQLKLVDNPADTETIYKNAILSFNKLGLLPDDMSIDYAQQLVTGKEQNILVIKILERLYNRKQETLLDENENLFCFISGSTINTLFAGPVPLIYGIHCISFWFRHIALLSLLEEHQNDFWRWWTQNFGGLHYSLLALRSILLVLLSVYINLLPIKFGAFMLYGITFIDPDQYGIWVTYPAEGWVNTISNSGNKSWNGSFIGYAIGFTGIKIIKGIKGGLDYFYLGTALKVHIKMY